jgi:hypothetical protein
MQRLENKVLLWHGLAVKKVGKIPTTGDKGQWKSAEEKELEWLTVK